MSYVYADERPGLFTEEGVEMLTAIRRNVARALKVAGAVRGQEALAGVGGVRGGGQHPNASVTGPQRVPDSTPPPTLPDGTLVWDWIRTVARQRQEAREQAVSGQQPPQQRAQGEPEQQDADQRADESST